MGNIQPKKGRDERDIELELYVQNMCRAHNGQGNPVFTCQICVKPMQSNQIFNNKNKCAHAVCKNCIAKYIQDKIDTKDKVPNIQCPGLNCNQFWTLSFARKSSKNHVASSWTSGICYDHFNYCYFMLCIFFICFYKSVTINVLDIIVCLKRWIWIEIIIVTFCLANKKKKKDCSTVTLLYNEIITFYDLYCHHIIFPPYWNNHISLPCWDN